MKKNLFIVLAFAVLPFAVKAQSLDTVHALQRTYYVDYSRWYANCLKDKAANVLYTNFTDRAKMADEINLSRPMVIRGVVALVSDWERDRYLPAHNCYDSEYVFISRFNRSKQDMDYLAIARWDTLEPSYVLSLRVTEDTSMNYDRANYPDGSMYCYAYEAYFDSAISVDSTFCVGATFNGNRPASPGSMFTTYWPATYVGMFVNSRDCILQRNRYTWLDSPYGAMWICEYAQPCQQGLYLPIVTYQWLVNSLSDDPAMGRAEGGNLYFDSSTVTLTAIPNPRYFFSHWNDGCTDNPRTFTATSDTTFTAYFRHGEYFFNTTRSNNDALGSTHGRGIYFEMDTVTISAHPNSGCHFDGWSDGDTANPRQFVITQDTTFTALFSKEHSETAIDEALPAAPAFSITPNPAHDRVTVTLSDSPAHASLVLRDAVGKELLRLSPVSQKTDIPLRDLPAGTYLLTLSSPQGSSTQKLIVE